MPTLPTWYPASNQNNISIANWDRVSGAWSGGTVQAGTSAWQRVDDPFTASVADGDTGIGPASGFNTTHVLNFTSMQALPADFQAMLTLSVRASIGEGNYSDDTRQLGATVFASDGTTAYSTQAGLRTANGAAANVYDTTQSVTLTSAGLAATKADWEAARIHVSFTDIRSMANDNGILVLVELALEGTYAALPTRPLIVVAPSVAAHRAASW